MQILEVNEFLEAIRKELKQGKIELDKVKIEIDKARTIGLDVRELTERYDSMRKQIELVEKTYKI